MSTLSKQNEASYSSSSEDVSLSVGAGGFIDVVSVWISGEGGFGIGASGWMSLFLFAGGGRGES